MRERKSRNSKKLETIVLLLVVCFFNFSAQAKYSGGSGIADDPYRIATAEDLMLLGDSPEDYNKHFIQTEDIDLEPNLPGRKVLDKAIVAPDTETISDFQGSLFTGSFDGNGYTISHLTISGESYIGMFGQLGIEAAISNLNLDEVAISGTGEYIGGIAGWNEGSIIESYSTGIVVGELWCVGGLVGYNSGSIVMSYNTGTIIEGWWTVGGLVGENRGSITNCKSTSAVDGYGNIGGLVGENFGSITTSYSTGRIYGDEKIGGLVGRSYQGGSITSCYNTGTVSGEVGVGGLVGLNKSDLNNCYSTGSVDGDDYIGGLVGENYGSITKSHSICTAVEGWWAIGGLVGENWGSVTDCNSTCAVSGDESIGGLVGENWETITISYSTGNVSGNWGVGGLVGYNNDSITMSYCTGAVEGEECVGGLVGYSDFGNITTNYSSSTVIGNEGVGGLVGENFYGSIIKSYSTGTVNGNSNVGGLMGYNEEGSITKSFWDIQTSGLTNMCGSQGDYAVGCDDSFGKTTAEMKDINTYLNAGWDFANEILNGTCDYWQISPGYYPRLSHPVMPEGLGTSEQPYLIRDAWDLGTMWFEPKAHYRLEASVDLSGIIWSVAVIPRFDGIFDGNGYVISNLYIQGDKYLGLFGRLGSGAKISNLGLEAVNISGSGDDVGGLAGMNKGSIATSYSTGTVTGRILSVFGGVGGLVGFNVGNITTSYSNNDVIGDGAVGGLVGINDGSITLSYSTGLVSGYSGIGGLVGENWEGIITESYSTSLVHGAYVFGGLVGVNYEGSINSSFWDVETSGLLISDGGVGKTTAEMQMAGTFLEAGWDFVSETENGSDDIWWMPEDPDYPKLWWELVENNR